MRYLSVSDADGRRRLVAEVDGQLRRVEDFADVGELLASGASAATGEPLDRSRLTIRSPLARPGKIICIGLNYRDHCREQNIEPPRYPMLFAKFGNAVNDPGGSVLRPRATEKLDLECELGVVIGRSASRIGPAEALDHVFGYTVVNDITMRDLQAEDRQWLRAKGADGFAPIGPAVVSRDEIADPQALAMRSSVNGETWQESSTAEMVFDVATLVAFVSTVIRLEPGDLIATGTPAGVGHYQRPPRYLADGDLLRCEIEGIGAIETTVIDEVPRIADHGHAAGIEALEGARR
jgi:2-keto-4-pentenoate hydratase/2-oxohepta-3-ene-1,7-dioic acid hydratase in catechol pathway